MKKCFFVLATIIAAPGVGSAIAQDPTVPSKEILQRMHRPVVQQQSVAKVELPSIKLKAIVMATHDRGTAIVEVDNRRLTIQLQRASMVASDEVKNATCEIEIAGRRYTVEDFSARSILLDCEGSKLLVQ